MKLLLARPYPRLLLCAAVGAAIPLAAAYATTPSVNALQGQGWRKVTAQVPAPNGACNYLYLDGTGRMIYYGASGNCAQRIGQHFAAMRSGYEMLDQSYRFLSDDTGNELKVYLEAWVTAIDDQGHTRNNGQSDNCLGVLSARAVPTIYFLSFNNAPAAFTAEACVLGTVVGYCNRQGQGSTRPSSVTFINALENCGA